MRKQLLVEDLTVIFQWVVAFLLAPFVLLNLFPREPVEFPVRFAVTAGAFLVWAGLTLIYLLERGRSRRRAGIVVNVIAVSDVALVTACMWIWPEFLPDLFWIFPLIVITVATRFDHRMTALVTLALSFLYAVTLYARIGTAPLRTVVGETLIRIVFLLLTALVTAYLSHRADRLRGTAKSLSSVAAAIGSTLDTQELLQEVVDGLGRVTGLDRCTVFLLEDDGGKARARATTEKQEDVRGKLLGREIDLTKRNAASLALERREPVIVTDVTGSPLVDRKWVEELGLGSIAVLPVMLRDEVKGVVVVERRGRKRLFVDREIANCMTIIAQAAAGLENALRYEQEQEKRSRADVLYRTSRELSSTLDMEQVLESACNLAMRSTGASGCSAFIADEGNGLLVPRFSLGPGRAKRVEFPHGSGIASREIESMYSLSDRPPALLVKRPAETAALPPFLREEGVVLLAPFFSHGRLAGVLCVSDAAEREFSEAQVSQFAAIAGETALAVENASLHERIRVDALQLASMVEMANAVGSTTELATITGLALDTVRHLFNCNAAVVYRVDEERGTLEYADSFGYSEKDLERLTVPPHTTARECWAASEGRLICVDDLSRGEIACRLLKKIGRGSSICAGMQVEGKTLGVLHVWSREPGSFAEDDQQLAMAVSDQLALAFQRALLFEEINRLAITDPLTGVFNVRRLEHILKDELNRARRYGRPLSFLMIDVDNLKAYNDTLGHRKGDVVLSQLASIIDSNTREVDKVFRYGGDEFSVVLPETDPAEAMVVADKVRAVVSEFHFPDEEKVPGGGVTVSVGVASFSGEEVDGVDDIISMADRALYLAKQKGRDSVASCA